MFARCALLAALAIVATAQYDPVSQRTVVMRLDPPKHQPDFMKQVEAPHAVPQERPSAVAPPQPQPAMPVQTPAAPTGPIQRPPATFTNTQTQFAGASPPGVPPAAAQRPVLSGPDGQTFVPRTIDAATPPPPPPVNLPPDVQNQLIKFFGLDSFGIPGLTGNHPNGFAGAIQELRAAGIPVQPIPVEHVGGQPVQAPQSDVLSGQNPAFANDFNVLANEARSGGVFHGSSNVPLPADKPGENGLIGILSNSLRKMVKDTGLADAISQVGLLGDGTAAEAPAASSSNIRASPSHDSEPISESSNRGDVRRQQTTAQRAFNGFASVLGGGGPNSPTHAGLPRIPGLPILPGGIPRNSQGQIDVVSLISSITNRVSNGTTLADVLPPEQLQTLADNVTDALLPATPENFDLKKFMGRWFEGINSPRATEQRCVVHHYGGLTNNDKTATFTALKIYREGSEFGTVRYSIGFAFRGGNKGSMLQLHSSESEDVQPFWVYKLGPEGVDPFGNKQYEYAVVSNWVKYPVTVLVRDPDTFKQKYEPEVLRWLEDQGFVNGFVRAFNMLQPASYNQCQYADSTFEVFGK
uniref:Lipocln_cytosolic_FA-bd_dom domain-containing protein n=1 Tax=Panagrellus redivivus TaxID=6233 RepID=A0A7E4VPZ2_PANRE